MSAILVTGGAGYIGSHACKLLSQSGWLPVTYDNLSTGHRYAVKWGPLVIGDLNDETALKKTLEEYKPKAVLHFAASAIIIESIHHPEKYYSNNVQSSISLLKAMRNCNIPYLVFSSTCATYGHPQFSPITEKHPQIPVTPYGKSKYMVEQIIADFEKAYGLQSVCLRYFNAAGADRDLEIGENHEPETHIIPSVIQTAMGKREEIVIYGNDFSTPDGSAIRDYIHVEDLADAHVKALKWLLKNNQSSQINLGTGKGYSVYEIVKSIQSFSQKKIPIRIEPKRIGEPSHLVASNQKAQELLGWTPQVSSLPNLISSAWNWHEKKF